MHGQYVATAICIKVGYRARRKRTFPLRHLVPHIRSTYRNQMGLEAAFPFIEARGDALAYLRFESF